VSYKFIPDYLDYYRTDQRTICDAQGFFTFRNLPDGHYYVSTAITWMVGNYHQGGSLMQQIKLDGGDVKEIVLSP